MLSLFVYTTLTAFSLLPFSDGSNLVTNIKNLDENRKCASDGGVKTILTQLVTDLENQLTTQKQMAVKLRNIKSDQKLLAKGQRKLEGMLSGKPSTTTIKSDQKLLAKLERKLERMLSRKTSTTTTTEESPEQESTTTKKPEPIREGRSCAEVISPTEGSGIYEIRIPSFSDKPFKVACDAETRGGNWTIILRRMDGSVSFDRDWDRYKVGFGQLDGEFFMGLDKLHAITNDQQQELFFLFKHHDGSISYERYEKFAIGDYLDNYKLHTLGLASGTAGDSFRIHHGMYFSTPDRNDAKSCASSYYAGWWFNYCGHCCLTTPWDDKYPIMWTTLHNDKYLQGVFMMIRPRIKSHN